MAIYVSDTFTDTNGTAIASHTPGTGGAWTGTNVTINSNQAVVGAFTNPIINNATTGATQDYDVQADLVMFGTTAAGSFGGVFARGNIAGGNYYVARYDAGAALIRLEKWASASPAAVGSPSTYSLTYAQNETHTLVLRCQGTTTTTLTVFLDGAQILTYADSTSPYTTAGVAGFKMQDTSANLAIRLDNFILQDIAVLLVDSARTVTRQKDARRPGPYQPMGGDRRDPRQSYH